MQPSKTDSLRSYSSFVENSVARQRSATNQKSSSWISTSGAPDARAGSGNGKEIRRIFARMKMTIHSIVAEHLNPEIAPDQLLIEVLTGSELVAYEFDREIAALCAAGHSADSTDNDRLSGEISRHASALARGRNRVCILKRSVEILLESTTPLLQRYHTPVRHAYNPFEREGNGIEAVCQPYLSAINAAIDAIAESTSKAIKARDFHGAALLSALASNLNDFVCDLLSMLGELFAAQNT